MDFVATEQKYKTNIEEYIIVLEDIVSEDLCDRILLEYKDSGEWDHPVVADHSVDLTLRNASIIPLSKPSCIEKNPILRKSLENEIFSLSEFASIKYNQMFPESYFSKDTGYELLRYEVGQYYVQHTDSYRLHPRTVSCSFSLNDDYEGGEFAFFDRKLKYKLRKGSAILFPSNFMFPHEIMPILKGTRYSIITWFIS
jgi:hypothetical protein